MRRGSTTPHVVVVHAWQVVVHERVRVDDLDRGGNPRRISRAARCPIGRDNEHAAKPLAAAFKSVDHGGTDGLGQISSFAPGYLSNRPFDVCPVFREMGRSASILRNRATPARRPRAR